LASWPGLSQGLSRPSTRRRLEDEAETAAIGSKRLQNKALRPCGPLPVIRCAEPRGWLGHPDHSPGAAMTPSFAAVRPSPIPRSPRPTAYTVRARCRKFLPLASGPPIICTNNARRQQRGFRWNRARAASHSRASGAGAGQSAGARAGPHRGAPGPRAQLRRLTARGLVVVGKLPDLRMGARQNVRRLVQYR
jgi:hypothetical protein